MKRTDVNRKKNRNNNTIFSHRASPTNLITSDIFGDIWVQNDHTTSGVQIVELRSSDSGKSADSLDDDKDYFPIPHQYPIPNQWCYTKESIEDDYRRNEAAREQRRLKNLNDARSNEFAFDTSDCEDGYVFAELFVSGARDRQPESVIYNQTNCFTILDNHLMNSDTSEEEFADIEVINYNETNSNWAHGEHNNYDDDVLRCDQEEQEKRTVWIYSFKNKHLLSDNDYELVNIPSQDLSKNSSGEDFQQPSVENNVRLSSPVPPYIPRLHLPITPPLPTLIEVSEPGRYSSANQTDEEKPIKRVGIKENNWFISEPSTSKQKVEQIDKSTSIVNWMALSPREKRRKLRNASPISLLSDLTGRLATVNEESTLIDKKEEMKADKLVDLVTKGTGETCQCVGDCASHVVSKSNDENDSRDVNASCDRSTLTEEKPQSSRSCHQSSNSGVKMEFSFLDSSDKSVRTIKSDLASHREPLNKEQSTYSSKEIEIQAEVHAPKDRGDHLPRLKPIPRIRINRKINSKTIAGPMENVESNNWIYEEKLINDDSIETPQDARGDRASDSLWVRNMALLKPSEWAEYERVFDQESIPSLHLSLNSDSIEENQTLFKRLSKYLNCCKLFCK